MANLTCARVDRNTALTMLQEMPLSTLMGRAYRERCARYPGDLATFVYDTNPNYGNICVTRCKFCAFYRDPEQDGAYTHSPEVLAAKVARAAAIGATTVLLQGGHNPEIKLPEIVAYIRAIKAQCPKIHIHPLSPSELAFLAEQEQCSVKEVLVALRNEGIDTIPGGGAEILVNRVRAALSPAKISATKWLEIMKIAHLEGFKTTATMMFGHIETPAEIVDHLFALRDIQDQTGGFSSFIPWSFKPGQSALSAEVSKPSHPAYYVRIIALARMVLDNFDHIQSSWFSENITAGQMGLWAGADDFGGLLVEENVLMETGFAPKTSLSKVLEIIRAAGFSPARRNSYYQIQEVYKAATDQSHD